MDDEIGWPTEAESGITICPEHKSMCLSGCRQTCAMHDKFREWFGAPAEPGPRPVTEPFPFHNHRTLAEVWGLNKEQAG